MEQRYALRRNLSRKEGLALPSLSHFLLIEIFLHIEEKSIILRRKPFKTILLCKCLKSIV